VKRRIESVQGGHGQPESRQFVLVFLLWCLYWNVRVRFFVVCYYLFEWKWQTKAGPHNKNKPVLLDADYATSHYTARFFHVQHKMKMWNRENPGASIDHKASMRKSWRGNWDYEKSTNESFGAVFEKKARDHEARQSGAKEEIKDNLNRNGRRSYASLEKAINQWCSKNTIIRYLKSNEDSLIYSQNVRPLLSEGNRIRQAKFSEHVRNRWELGSDKRYSEP
jgi:hypothetical protein